MFIFISWSGEKSSRAAIALNDWLPLVFQSVKPWMSRYDIPVGSRWHTELSNALDATDFGIICLTKENVGSPWVLFESGALAKSLSHGRIVPYLIDIDFSELTGPLSYFQGIKADREGTLRLIKEIAEINKGNFRNEKALETVFEKFWDDLEKQILPLRNRPEISVPITNENKPAKMTDNLSGKRKPIKKNKIVFIEDRPISIFEEIEYCKKLGFEVEVVETPNRLMSILNDNYDNILLIISDIMLPNIHDLSSAGIFEVQTDHGYMAGWTIVEYILRTENSRYKDIPIILFSVRPQSEMDHKRINELMTEGGGWIEYLEKGGYDINGQDSFDKFKGLVQKAMTKFYVKT